MGCREVKRGLEKRMVVVVSCVKVKVEEESCKVAASRSFTRIYGEARVARM
jgi:hypothetical protein